MTTHEPIDAVSDREVAGISPADTLTPAERYQELFVAVQMGGVFEDSKTFVDCEPKRHPERILADYRDQSGRPGFDLRAFVQRNFDRFRMAPSDFVADPDASLIEHIDSLWPVLTREPRRHPPRSSLLPLPYRYVVPGGRFTELYYWDSYFTMLGLDASGECELLRAMADNFAYLIDTYGHVPNGNRTYYLGRSQPPVFALMTDLFDLRGIHRATDYLPQLHKEYAYWMDGADGLRPGECYRRCVCLADGVVLNRYWDDRDTPREESYREDVHTAEESDRPAREVYRDLRAGAESGWDFSSRWLADPHRLSTIRTTAIVPIDLNALLYKLETQIARLSAVKGHDACAKRFGEKAERRRQAIDRYLWCDEHGAYFDYDWALGQPRDNLTAATVVPLYVNLASAAQATRIADTVRYRLLAPGGLSTTEFAGTGEQWDRPNGWAPLQWMAIRGFERYGHRDLSREIEHRWLTIVAELYRHEGKLVEKYVLRPTVEHAAGGEYPLQDGFGWTNGVTRQLLAEDPAHGAGRCRAACSRHEDSRGRQR
ncbi:alpha,alpha-trehalase TreF [Stutzerimonas urumqiensis]|uniref:alpha,alpha-trehalase TreF n=1 Tax=Stutzerimonas urumqiensis TaxID=638269 RepID=UPI003DA3FEB0